MAFAEGRDGENVTERIACHVAESPYRRMFKKAIQQGSNERRPEAYPLGYVEDLSDARTKLVDFFNILLLNEIQLDAQLFELISTDGRRRIGQRTLCPLRFGERDHVADRVSRPQ